MFCMGSGVDIESGDCEGLDSCLIMSECAPPGTLSSVVKSMVSVESEVAPPGVVGSVEESMVCGREF